MRILVPTARYRRDLKRIQKRGWGLQPLADMQERLRLNVPLPFSAHPHKLSGEWEGFWECHIQPDWLLIYDFTDTEVILVGTGTHADLLE